MRSVDGVFSFTFSLSNGNDDATAPMTADCDDDLCCDELLNVHLLISWTGERASEREGKWTTYGDTHTRVKTMHRLTLMKALFSVAICRLWWKCARNNESASLLFVKNHRTFGALFLWLAYWELTQLIVEWKRYRQRKSNAHTPPMWWRAREEWVLPERVR